MVKLNFTPLLILLLTVPAKAQSKESTIKPNDSLTIVSPLNAPAQDQKYSAKEEISIKPSEGCNEIGKVVLKITVDREGNVLDAVVARGTTNNSECLVKQAKELALKTKFNPDENAPEKQVGSIVYDFKLKD